MRDLRRVTTGPRYAEAHRRRAEDVRRARSSPRRPSPGGRGSASLEVTSPSGRLRVDADAVVLATGARERPRAARLVPGTRRRGVSRPGSCRTSCTCSTGRVGTRAVVVGGELVQLVGGAHAARGRLRDRAHDHRAAAARRRTPRSELLGRTALRTPVATGVTQSRGSSGRPDVTGVELEQIATGRTPGRRVRHRRVHRRLDPRPRARALRRHRPSTPPRGSPRVDASLRTDRAGVFAIGNLVHPVDTADVAALDGAAVVPHVLAFLRGERPAPSAYVDLVAEPPLRWVSPSRLAPDDGPPPRGRLLLWSDEHVNLPTVVVRQDGRVVSRTQAAVAGRAGPRLPGAVVGARRRRPAGRRGLDRPAGARCVTSPLVAANG